jgi:hypothetical protein
MLTHLIAISSTVGALVALLAAPFWAMADHKARGCQDCARPCQHESRS